MDSPSKPMRQAADDSVEANGRSRWATWRDAVRAPFTARTDSEHVQILLRMGLLAVALGALLLMGAPVSDRLLMPTTLVTIGALLVATLMAIHLVRDPVFSPRRRIVGILLDFIYLASTVFLLQQHGVWLVPFFALVAVDASLRYGRNYGYFATGLGALAFLLVHVLEATYWRGAGALVGSYIVMMILVPAYVAAHSHELRVITQTYQRRARKMARAAMEDPLTMLANRVYFRRALEKSVARARLETGAEGFAILYCDLDGFKSINDTHGHHVGDLVLKAVARALKTCVRGSDIVARLGGDEFAIILKGIDDEEIARRIGKSIVQRVQAINRLEGRAIKISCSVGITLVVAPLGVEDNLEDIVARSDEAMYRAKRAGKNQFVLQWANPALEPQA